jgi:hypothetical protein
MTVRSPSGDSVSESGGLSQSILAGEKAFHLVVQIHLGVPYCKLSVESRAKIERKVSIELFQQMYVGVERFLSLRIGDRRNWWYYECIRS